MTPRTTRRPTMVRTMLPPPALCAALTGSSDEPRFTVLSSLLPAAKATGAVSRQLKTAAGRMAWRVRIFSEGGGEPGSGSRLVSAGGCGNLNVDRLAIGSGHPGQCRSRATSLTYGDCLHQLSATDPSELSA